MAHLKTEAAHFVKDTSSGALLNTDVKGFRAHKEARARRLADKESTESRLSALESNMAEMLTILRALQTGPR